MGAWFYTDVLGVQQSVDSTGFSHLVIKPTVVYHDQISTASGGFQLQADIYGMSNSGSSLGNVINTFRNSSLLPWDGAIEECPGFHVKWARSKECVKRTDYNVRNNVRIQCDMSNYWFELDV